MRRAVLLSCLAAASCSRCEGPAPPRDVKTPDAGPPPITLVLGATQEPSTLDPAFTDLSGPREIISLLFRDLTELDDAWKLVPALAAELPRAEQLPGAEQSQRVKWRLREGYGWSDGHPLTTQDILQGFRIESDEKLEAVSHQVATHVARMHVLSPLELAVDWKTRYADYRAPRVHAILPAHAYPEPSGSSFQGMGRAPTSNGPYRLVEWRAGQRIVLEKNAHWGGAVPTIDRIVFRFFPGEEALEAELLTGGVDAVGEAAGLSLDRAKSLEARLKETHAVHYTDSGVWLHLGLRLNHPALSKLSVRQALARAVDRDALGALLYAGESTPAYGLYAPRHPAHRGDLPGIPYDLDGARRLIADAKLSARDRRLALQFATGSQASERAAAYVAAQLQKIGLEVRLEPLPLRVLFAKMREGTHAPLALFAWRERPDWDGASVLSTGGRQNFGGFSDPDTDRCLAEAAVTLDPARWQALLGEVDGRFRALLPAIPLVFRREVSLRPRWLQGWRPTGTVTPVTWNAEAWTVKPDAPRR